MDTTPIASGSFPLPLNQPGKGEITKAKEAFGEILTNTIQQTNHADMAGNKAIVELQTGAAKNLHEVMIATEQADISIRMLVQMRNKALEAYNEIMRLQI